MKNLGQTFLRTVLVLAAMTMMACQKNSDGGGDPQPSYVPPYGAPYGGQPYGPYNPQGCGTCAPNAQLLAPVQGVWGSNFQIRLDLLGDPAAGFNLADPKAVVVYNGPVMANGQMNISAPFVQSCNLPPGTYNLQTINPGTMMAATARNLVMEGLFQQDPNLRVTLMIVQGVIFNPTNGTSSQTPNNFGAYIVFQSVNGQPCGQGNIVTH